MSREDTLALMLIRAIREVGEPVTRRALLSELKQLKPEALDGMRPDDLDRLVGR